MKLLILIVLLSLLTFSCSSELSSTNTLVYYYCTSHKMDGKVSKITYILYTDILKISRDEQVIKEKTSEWGKLVKLRCKNTTGCTSDLNYYSSAKEAATRRNEMLDKYKDPQKYQIEKVEFK